MAVKLLLNENLLGVQFASDGQDFVLVDSETFFTGDPAEYRLVNEATLSRSRFASIWAWLRLLCRPRLLNRIRLFVGKTPSSPLTSSYFSTVPFRLGPGAVKYVVYPRSPEAIAQETPDYNQDPNGLAKALVMRLGRSQTIFDFGVDVQVDSSAQPIEDPTRCWSQAQDAKRVWLAELTIPIQAVDPGSLLAENLSFSPWHCLPAHEPLGFINRARKPIYRAMTVERHRQNQVTPPESDGAPLTYGQRPEPLNEPIGEN